MDWDAFNRSVGRTIGGHNECFNEQPKRLPPATRGSFDEPIDTPRWMVLVAVVLGLAISLEFIAMAFGWVAGSYRVQ